MQPQDCVVLDEDQPNLTEEDMLGFLGSIDLMLFGIGRHNLRHAKNAKHLKLTTRSRGNRSCLLHSDRGTWC